MLGLVDKIGDYWSDWVSLLIRLLRILILLLSTLGKIVYSWSKLKIGKDGYQRWVSRCLRWIVHWWRLAWVLVLIRDGSCSCLVLWWSKWALILWRVGVLASLLCCGCRLTLRWISSLIHGLQCMLKSPCKLIDLIYALLMHLRLLSSCSRWSSSLIILVCLVHRVQLGCKIANNILYLLSWLSSI